ncbi:MAG TPA: hypothetical protein VMX13_15845 [Sedimentisphaerales bacterium]|nr:hypothetical protein [Sedimentisphaerales bacterium]
MSKANNILLKAFGLLLLVGAILKGTQLLTEPGVTTPVLALNEPANTTSSYEILEPETWVGKKLPLIDYIDIGESLEKGNWLILLYHYDCPDCAEAIPKYERMARDLVGNGDFLRIALIEMPPYGPPLAAPDSLCTLGRLANTKQWFVTTPAVVLLVDGRVNHAWEAKAPDFDAILSKIASSEEKGPFAHNGSCYEFTYQQSKTPKRWKGGRDVYLRFLVSLFN